MMPEASNVYSLIYQQVKHLFSLFIYHLMANTFSQMYELIELPLGATDAMGRQKSAKYRWWSLHALTGLNRVQMYECNWENPHMTPGFQDPYNDDYVWGARARYAFGRVSARGQIYSMPA